ncbi:MAG: hypothetical protein WC655_27090, partial [Candidatus Hydrogenedentales bacterium]
PLYYILSAPIHAVAVLFMSPDAAARALRIIPLAAGMVQIELCYRAVRAIWADRDDLQQVGILAGGAMPVNFYISQYVSNEPLAGVLVSGVVVCTLILLSRTGVRLQVWRGVLFGLALITKISALAMVIPLAFSILQESGTDAHPKAAFMRKAARAALLCFGIAALVSGWYFARNMLELGRPFFGGWEPERGIVWWQDPGYRTVRQVFSPGAALSYPVFSGVESFSSGLYSTLFLDGMLSAGVYDYTRPPWNFSFMLTGAWLGLLPSLLIFAGMLRALRTGHVGLSFVTLSVIVHIGALFYGFITVPYFCILKGSYTVGMLPCYAVLGAAGFDAIARTPLLKALALGGLFCGAVTAYAAYFIL